MIDFFVKHTKAYALTFLLYHAWLYLLYFTIGTRNELWYDSITLYYPLAAFYLVTSIILITRQEVRKDKKKLFWCIIVLLIIAQLISRFIIIFI